MIQLAFNAGSGLKSTCARYAEAVEPHRFHFASRPDQLSDVAADLRKVVWPLFAGRNSHLRATTFKTFPLAEAEKAHALMESVSKHGKIILTT